MHSILKSIGSSPAPNSFAHFLQLISPEVFNAVWQKIFKFFDDSDVDEVLINAHRSMAIVRSLVVEYETSPFADADAMVLWLQEFASRCRVRLDALCGQAGGVLETDMTTIIQDSRPALNSSQSWRWHCLLPPLAFDGPLLSLRRHRFTQLSFDSFLGDQEDKQRLAAHVQARKPLLIAGATAAGKSSLLATLLKQLAIAERVFIIESIAELPLAAPHWVRLVERRANLEGKGAVSLERLIQEALRLRPDRLVIGEIRSSEARAFIEAITTGHGGVIATIHASNPENALSRLAYLTGMSGKNLRARKIVQHTELAVAVMERGAPPALKEFSQVS